MAQKPQNEVILSRAAILVYMRINHFLFNIWNMGTAAVGVAPVNSGVTSQKCALGGRASQSFMDPSKQVCNECASQSHIVIQPLTRINYFILVAATGSDETAISFSTSNYNAIASPSKPSQDAGWRSPVLTYLSHPPSPQKRPIRKGWVKYFLLHYAPSQILMSFMVSHLRLKCAICGVCLKTIAAYMAHQCGPKTSVFINDKGKVSLYPPHHVYRVRVWSPSAVSDKLLGVCHRLDLRSNLGCYETTCEFEAVEERDIVLHIQNAHNNGKEVTVWY